MKFNLEETVTGADLCPGVTLLTVPREHVLALIEELELRGVSVDGLQADETQATVAVVWDFPQNGERSLPLSGLRVEPDCFRLTLQGHRLTDQGGLGALWTSVLTDEGVTPRLTGCFSGGITQYLPESSRRTVLSLLNRTFGVRVV